VTYSEGIFHLIALLCTLLVEGAGMALWASFAYSRPWYATGCALVVNLIVHTLFWYSQSNFAAEGSWGLYRAELLVVLLEGMVYFRFLSLRGITPWLLSFCLNLASFLAGLLLWQIIL